MASMYSRVGSVTLPFPQKNNSRNWNVKPTTPKEPQKATRQSFSTHNATGRKTNTNTNNTSQKSQADSHLRIAFDSNSDDVSPTFNQLYQDESGHNHNKENRRALPPQDTIHKSGQPHHHHQDMEISQLTTYSEEFTSNSSAKHASFGMLSKHQIGSYDSQGSRPFGQDDQGTLTILSGSYSPNESEQNEDGPETHQHRQPSQSQGSRASSSSSSSTTEGYDSQKRQHRFNEPEAINATGREVNSEHSAVVMAASFQVPPKRGPHHHQHHHRQQEIHGFQNARTEEARHDLEDSQTLRLRSARDSHSFQAPANQPSQFEKAHGGNRATKNTSTIARPRDANFQSSSRSAGLYGGVRMRQLQYNNFSQERDGVTVAHQTQKELKQKCSYLASLNNLGTLSHVHSNRATAKIARQSNNGQHFGKPAQMEGLQNDRAIVSIPTSVRPRQVEELRTEFLKYRDESNARITEQTARVESLIQEMQSLSKDQVDIVAQTIDKANDSTKAKEEAQSIVDNHKDCVNTTVKLIREMGANAVRAIQEAGIAASSEQQTRVAEIRSITTESKRSLEKTRDALVQSFCTAIFGQLPGLQEVVNGGWNIFLPKFKSFMESHTGREANLGLPMPPEDERRKSKRKKGLKKATITVIYGKKCMRLPQEVHVTQADSNVRNSSPDKEGASRVPCQNTPFTASNHKLRRSKREKSAVTTYKELSRVGCVWVGGPPPARVRKSQKETTTAKNRKAKRPSGKKRNTGSHPSLTTTNDTSMKGPPKKKKKKKASLKHASSPQVTYRGLTKKANQITPVASAPFCVASAPSLSLDDHHNETFHAEFPLLTKSDTSFFGAPLVRPKNKKKRKSSTPEKFGSIPHTAGPVKRQKPPTPVSLGKGLDRCGSLEIRTTPADPFEFDDMV